MACPKCGSTSVIILSIDEKYDHYKCVKCGIVYSEKK